MARIQREDTGYDVFLSYRHKPRDNKICKRVHTLLETFKPPRRFKNADIKRVFRDDEELPAAGVLSDTIGDALSKARVLLVICSTATPQSQWVDREVRTFIESGRSEKIYALLIEGTPETSFPPSLRLVPGMGNRTLELKGNAKINKKLKKELLKVIAAATDVPFESLRLSIRRRKVVRSIAAGIALSIFLFASGFYSLYQWTRASYYNLYAQREEMVIRDVISGINSDLTSAVESIPGASKPLIKIVSDNITYLDRMMEIGGRTPESLKQKGSNYLSLSRAYMLDGDHEGSKKAAREAVDIFESLARKNKGTSFKSDLAICYNLSGLFMQSLSEYEDALEYYGKSIEVYKEIDETTGTNEFSLIIADTHNFMATCYYYLEDYEKSAHSFIEEMKIRKKLLGKKSTPEERQKIADIASVVGSLLVSTEKYKEAKSYNNEAMELYKAIFEENDSNAQYHKAYAVALYSLGTNLTYLKEDERAEYYIKLSLVESDKLTANLPEFEPMYFCMYAMYDLLYGDESKKQEALNSSAAAYTASPGDGFIRHVYAYSLLYNGYYNEALKEFKTLVGDGVSKPDDILQDFKMFRSRGRWIEEMDHIMEELQ